jgi:hypothetical protein
MQPPTASVCLISVMTIGAGLLRCVVGCQAMGALAMACFISCSEEETTLAVLNFCRDVFEGHSEGLDATPELKVGGRY